MADPLQALQASTYGVESSFGKNPSTSNKGARGPMQIMPATFAQFALPGENIDNPDDNKRVGDRILAHYYNQYGDPARAAVAYFSGPGNVSPPGSALPYLQNRSDGGNTVSQYLAKQGLGSPDMANVGPNTYSQMQTAQAQQAAQTQPYNPWASDWSNPLIQAGAALMASSEPRGAAALGAIAGENLKNLNEQRKLQQDNLSTITLPNGDVVQIDKSSGRIVNTGINGAAKEHVTRTNFFGESEVGAFDPKTGQTTWEDDPDATKASNVFQKLIAARDAQDPNRPLKERREELIKMLPPEFQDFTRARIEGRAMPGGGQGVAGKIARVGQLFANTIDPETMDDSVYNARKSLRQSEASGTFAQGFVSARTATEHAYQAKQLVDAINNKDIPLQNSIINKIKEATGDPNITNAQTALLAVANEFGRVVHGPGAQADAAVARWSHGLNPNGAPSQLYGGLDTMINDLADARIRSVEEQHRLVFKEEPPDFLGKRYRDMQAEIHKAAVDSAAKSTFHGTGNAEPVDLNKFLGK